MIFYQKTVFFYHLQFYNCCDIIIFGDLFMGKFIEKSSFCKFFYYNRGFSVSNVGYDDFSIVKPEKVFRTQKIYTWHFVLSGSGTLEIYGKKYKLCAGDMFFIPPDQKMRYYPDKAEPWEYVWFAFSGDEIKAYGELAGFSKSKPTQQIQNFEKIKYILKKLFEKLLANDCGHFGVLGSFFEILELCDDKNSLTGIRLVKKLIDENFASSGFSIEQLCRDVNISHAHLLRLFKAEYNTTLVKYIIDRRIKLACELLKTTDLSVGSVAFSCGFSDEIHFMKTFKRSVGCCALEFRKNLGNQQ